jgi:hypothetical protein
MAQSSVKTGREITWGLSRFSCSENGTAPLPDLVHAVGGLLLVLMAAATSTAT